MPWRSLFFTITAGGGVVFSNEALARPTDPDEPCEVERHAQFVADLIVCALTAGRVTRE